MQEMWMSFWGERHGNHNESQSQTNIFRTPSNHLPSITLKYPIIATAVRERRSRRRSTDECVWPTHFILVLLLDCMFSDGSFDRHPATRKEPRETKAGRSAVLSTSAHQEDTECCGEPPFPWIISRVLRLLPTSTSDPQRSMDAGPSASIPPYAKQLAPMQTQNSRWHGLADAPLTTTTCSIALIFLLREFIGNLPSFIIRWTSRSPDFTIFHGQPMLPILYH